MKKIKYGTPFFNLLSALLIFSVAGCVSTSKYKKLEADNKTQIDTLTQKNQEMEKQLAELNEQTESLKQSKVETESEYQEMVNQLQQEVEEGNLQVTQYKNMMTVDVAEKLFFDSGSAKLKKTGQDVLSKVAQALVQYDDKIIRVEGHTDNVPLAAVRRNVFPTNWELSVIRATNVVRYLQEQGKIPPERLIASGRGEFEPVAPNDTPEGRKKNRRIEIMLIDKSVVDALQTKPN